MSTDEFLSEALNGILDGIGLDENVRQKRKVCQKMMQLLQKWSSENIKNQLGYPIFAGSQYETTTVAGLSSDIDNLIVWRDYRVIQDIKSQWIRKRVTYLVDETDCYKSYLKLYLVSPVNPSLVYNEIIKPLQAHHVLDESGKVLFSSKLFIEYIRRTKSRHSISHGPAITERISNLEVDSVIALPCNFFPRCALKWKTRQTPDTLLRVGKSIIAAANHCHVVAVGNKSSPNESVEWRYSFTHIERELVHSWNNVQYKLYVMKKFILKDLIEPHVPDVISSYHIKTIMFWMNEEYPCEFFGVSNFSQCLSKYLTNLAETVRRKSLPHYFIEDCNLFHNKMDERKSRQLTQILQHMLNTWPRSLFDIQRRGLGLSLYHVLSGDIPLFLMMILLKTLRYGSYECEYLDSLFPLTVEVDVKHDFHEKTVREVDHLLNLLEQQYKDVSPSIEMNQLLNFINHDFRSYIGIQCLIKESLHPDTVDTRDVIQAVTYIQRYANDCCIDTRLRIAAYLVFTGDFHGGTDLLDRIACQIKPYTRHDCFHNGCNISDSENHRLHMRVNKPAMHEFFTLCRTTEMEYKPEMIGHLPKALVYEMFRSTSLSTSVSHMRDNLEWHRHAIIHCPVFMYFLRFVISQAKGLYIESKAAINNMEITSKQPDIANTTHSETNHNVIGHCHMELGDTQNAYREYKESLYIKKCHNAALWHIAILLRRKIRSVQ